MAQLVMTLPTLGIIFGGAPAGWLVERYGGRRVLLTSFVAYALCGAAPLGIDSIELLLASRLLLGFATTCITTSAVAIIGTLYEGETRVRLIGYHGALSAASGVVSILLGGVIGELGGWRAPFCVYLAPLVLLPLAALFIPSTEFRRTHVAREPQGWLRRLLPWYALVVALYVAVFMTNVQISFLLALDGHTRPAVQGAVIGTASLMGVVGSLVHAPLHRRLGDRGVFLLMLLQMAVGLSLLGVSTNLAITTLGCALNGFGSGLAFPQMMNTILDRAPQEARGRASGLTYTSIFLGDFLNPIVVAPLALTLGLHGAFTTIGLAAGAAFVITLVTRARSSAAGRAAQSGAQSQAEDT